MPKRKATEIMTRSVVTLEPGQDIYTAMRILLDRRISGAPVVDAKGHVVGILSEKDCLKVLAAEAYDGLPEGHVGDYMTKVVESVTPNTGVYEIVDRFLSMPYRRLPVIDRNGRLVGQISRRDVLAAIESMRENSYLYGTKEPRPLDVESGSMGVDTAMRIARGR